MDSNSAKAYETLMQAILAGDLRPNQHLVETEIAVSLGMSRTPVREALGRLLQEGYLKKLSTGKHVVAELTVTDVRRMVEILEPLEVAAIRLACQRATQEQVGLARQAFDNLREAISNRELNRCVEMNNIFHTHIYAGSQNEQLCSIIQSLGNRYYDRAMTRSLTSKNWSSMMALHQHILEALQERDLRKAENAVRKHVRIQLRLALERFGETPELNE